MAPPQYALEVSNSFKSELAPSLLQAESMFTRNGDTIFINIWGAKVSCKDIHAKRMDRVKVIRIDNNLIGSPSVIF